MAAVENDGVLVLGTQRRESLAVMRSLGRAGHRIVAARFGRATYGERSRFCREVWPLPSFDSGEQFVAEALAVKLRKRPVVRWVFPIGDVEIDFCQRFRSQFPKHVSCVMPRSEITELCLDKDRLLDAVNELGIPTGRFARVGSGDLVRWAIEEVGLPCVVKAQTGLDTLGGLKALVLQTTSDVEQCRRYCTGLKVPLIVQTFATGHRHNVYFLAAEGELLSALQVKILRTDRLDGTGYAVDGISTPLRPDLNAHCSRLIHRLGYQGVGCAQFLVDDDRQQTVFLEVNSRLGANFAIACACGFDLPRLFLELLRSGRGGFSLPTEQYPTRRYAWTMGDLHGFSDAWRNRELDWYAKLAWLTRMLSTSLRADLHISWQWSDPQPTLALVRAKAASLLQQALSRRPARSHKPVAMKNALCP